MKEEYTKRLTELVNKQIQKSFGDSKTLTIYADYRDGIDPQNVADIISGDYPENELNDFLWAYYSDSIDYYIDAARDAVLSAIEDEPALLFGKDADTITHKEYKQVMEVAFNDIFDQINETVEIELPIDTFERSRFRCNLFIDTGDANYCYRFNAEAADDPDNLDERASAVWLARTQGYTKEDVIDVLKGKKTDSPFLNSLARELANCYPASQCLTFLLDVDLNTLMEASKLSKTGKGAITIAKHTMTGMFDIYNGAGSLLEIELEKDIEIPAEYISSLMPDGYGCERYSIDRVYGLIGGCWKNTVKEVKAEGEEEVA